MNFYVPVGQHSYFVCQKKYDYSQTGSEHSNSEVTLKFGITSCSAFPWALSQLIIIPESSLSAPLNLKRMWNTSLQHLSADLRHIFATHQGHWYSLASC